MGLDRCVSAVLDPGVNLEDLGSQPIGLTGDSLTSQLLVDQDDAEVIAGQHGLANRCDEHGPPAGADCLSGELIAQPVAGVRKSDRDIEGNHVNVAVCLGDSQQIADCGAEICCCGVRA